MKKLFVISLIFLLILSVFSLAHGEETFSQAEDIIKDKVPCEDLSDEQLESLGDYYMEQMHPGESHTSMDEMMGGTFTISNGGVFGSLLSSPILNAPQSGILGMHTIQKRPVVVNDEIVIRPMMYLSLSYDHRVVDGKGAVTFLVRVKENLEDPQRLVLDL